MPKTVRKCFGMMDLDILLPCNDCSYIEGCFIKTFEDVYMLKMTEDEEEAIRKAFERMVKKDADA